MASQAWAERIDACVRAGGPDIVFQPIVKLWERRVVGYEALSRFGGQFSPDEWFAAADRYGRTIALETSALRAALACLDRIPDGCYLSVNASELMIQQPEFTAMLREHDVSRIQIEVTERRFIVEYESIQGVLEPLRADGLQVAVDDLGTAHSSLQQVIRTRPDAFKADRWLIRSIDASHGWPERATVSALVQLASRLGISLVQEGIETEDQAAAIALLGVGYGQGYLFGRGSSIEELAG
jgi:EAL domain-containing protein (putative c-di-GMP-specific phosphodiesterase class I)